MDVNETLRELREALAQWHLRGDVEGALAAADTIATRAQALDEWLSAGGFLPDGWNRDHASHRVGGGV